MSSSEYIQAPASYRQKRLRALAGMNLGLHQSVIGLNQSFLQLGGDSITAMRLVTAARAENIGLTVANILQSTSLAELDSMVAGLDESQSTIEAFELI